METFELYDVERVVGETSFLRGLDYFERGRVRTAKFVPPDRIQGEVSGSRPEPYAVMATLAPRSDGKLVPVEGRCSCPVGHNCKHVAALLLAARRLSLDTGDDRDAATPAKVSGSVRGWLHEWSETVAGGAKHMPARPVAGPPAAGQKHLFYVIGCDAMRRVLISPYRAYLRKDGTIGSNFREYNEERISRTHEFLTSQDAALLGRCCFPL